MEAKARIRPLYISGRGNQIETHAVKLNGDIYREQGHGRFQCLGNTP